MAGCSPSTPARPPTYPEWSPPGRPRTCPACPTCRRPRAGRSRRAWPGPRWPGRRSASSVSPWPWCSAVTGTPPRTAPRRSPSTSHNCRPSWRPGSVPRRTPPGSSTAPRTWPAGTRWGSPAQPSWPRARWWWRHGCATSGWPPCPWRPGPSSPYRRRAGGSPSGAPTRRRTGCAPPWPAASAWTRPGCGSRCPRSAERSAPRARCGRSTWSWSPRRCAWAGRCAGWRTATRPSSPAATVAARPPGCGSAWTATAPSAPWTRRSGPTLAPTRTPAASSRR